MSDNTDTLEQSFHEDYAITKIIVHRTDHNWGVTYNIRGADGTVADSRYVRGVLSGLAAAIETVSGLDWSNSEVPEGGSSGIWRLRGTDRAILELLGASFDRGCFTCPNKVNQDAKVFMSSLIDRMGTMLNNMRPQALTVPAPK